MHRLGYIGVGHERTFLNVVIFAHDLSEVPDPDKLTAPAERGEIERLFKGWNPQLAEIAKIYSTRTRRT